jgi:Two component regulator propeller
MFTVYFPAEDAKSIYVLSLLQDHTGVVWCGTRNGLYRVETAGAVKFVFVDLGISDYLESRFIECLLEDRPGTLWIGADSGLFRRWPDARIDAYTTRDGLPDNIINSVLEDREGQIWVGMPLGGLCRLVPDPAPGRKVVARAYSVSGEFWGNNSPFPGQLYLDAGAINSGAVIIRTTGTGGTITERMRVTATGGVGIGTSSPTAGIKLEVNGNTLMTFGSYDIQFGTPNSEGGFSLIKSATGSRADLRFDGSTLKLVARPGGIPASTNGLAITATGNVGIGIDPPTIAKLHVLGGAVSITKSNGIPGDYIIDFGFKVDDRFLSVTPRGSLGANVGATFFLGFTGGVTANQAVVDPFLTDVDYATAHADANFMIIIY